MNIKELEKKYKLDFDAIAEILKKKHITINLEHLNDVPELWGTIIENSLGLKADDQEEDNTQINIQSKPTKKAHTKPEPSKKKPKTTKSSKNYFYAYVKFIGPDQKHAFVKRIDDLNSIANLDLYAKDDTDYKLQEDCAALAKGQIILCELRSKKFNLAKIKATFFEGSVVPGNRRSKFIDWLSFEKPLVINDTKAIGFGNDDNIGVTTLFFDRFKIRCEKQNVEANTEVLIPKIEKNVLQIISKEEFSEEDLYILKTYKANVDRPTYEETFLDPFNHELENNKIFSTVNTIETFVKKWQEVDVNLVTYANLKQEDQFFLFFELWLKGTIPINFWEEHLIDACIQFELAAEDVNAEDNSILSFELLLKPTHIERISKEITTYFEQELIIDSIAVYEALEKLVGLSVNAEKDAFYPKLNNSLNEDLEFQFWVAEKTNKFPKGQALSKFSEQDASTQERIIQKLEDNELAEIFTDTKELSNPDNLNRFLALAKDQLIHALYPVSFDIESDTEVIFELAWNELEKWTYLSNESQVDEGLELFNSVASNAQNILLGHNIVDFDCPLLAKKGVEFNEGRVWDTFLIEVLLNPNQKNFALVTKHAAKADAELTLDLFLNQVMRILKTPNENMKVLLAYLPETIVSTIEALKGKVHLDWISKVEIIKRSKLFFRPQPKLKGVVKELKQRLEESKAKIKLIVGPADLKSDILEYQNIKFSEKGTSDLDFAIIDAENLKDASGLDLWLKSVMITYLNQCKELNRIAYWGNIPQVVKIRLEEHPFDIHSLFKKEQVIDWSQDNLLFLTADELYNYTEDLRGLDDIDIFVVQPDLISVTQKLLLKNFDLDFLANVNSDNHFWLKFSGGQSYVPVSRNQCENLGVEIPDHLTKYWIEKYLFGKYRIWGTYNWEELLETIPYKKKKIIALDIKDFKKDQTCFARVNVTKSNSQGVIRFNPESVYRSRYWVFQKELVQQTIIPGKLTVLFIQRPDELDVLEGYFRSLGYYIPDSASSLGRQLELLYNSRKTKKIIINDIKNLSRIINANYLGELNVVIDSFNLTENYYVSQDSNLFKTIKNEISDSNLNDTEELISEDNDSEDVDYFEGNKPLVKDTFLLLKLHLPQILHYRNLLFHSNPNHKLWILDPRVNDFPDLSSLWNASRVSMNLWQDNESYESDVKEADKHISSAKPVTDLPFETNEIKDILSQVFLNGNSWYDYQKPYLDLIIPGKTDLLVTLPTGGGKSLLFQAPALFKSTFTNRLTIVVTPLKALMEDQVDALWKKGFYGSVEYLNADRSTDTQLIYRALAGGEIALLFITPERFRSKSFKNALNVRLQSDGGLEYIVFDEAHCVSQWGHEFRPDYFNCAKEVYKIKLASPNDIPLLLFSATVSEKIYQDFNRIFS
ncbi:DEAD/DEAH box helicase [Pareuzebyella sediminis]|uniref:DEAD/DEAH box helicase n=1 Tax=Pareuzebyella sediminis TaxID=2607998 RepID=UPI0011EE7641|nr:DEAD/DEAH box helicase [Pareuzebyella sediminis]